MAHIGGQPLNQLTLRNTFTAADQSHNGAIDYRELQMALASGSWRPLNMETAKMLVELFDRNHDGTINFDEYTELYRFVTDWTTAFRVYDKLNCGSIAPFELQGALRAFGYILSSRFCCLLLCRYDRGGKMYLDEFVQSCIFIKAATDTFGRYDRQKSGKVNVRFEEFIVMTMLVLA